MTALVIDRIGLLVTNDPALGEGPLGIVRNAALVLDEGRVVAVEPALVGFVTDAFGLLLLHATPTKATTAKSAPSLFAFTGRWMDCISASSPK